MRIEQEKSDEQEFLKNFENPLDQTEVLWYNINVRLLAGGKYMNITYEEYVRKTKEEYNKMSAEEVLENFIELAKTVYNEDRDETNTNELEYKDDHTRYEIVKFLILERLKYFDSGDDDIRNFTWQTKKDVI